MKDHSKVPTARFRVLVPVVAPSEEIEVDIRMRWKRWRVSAEVADHTMMLLLAAHRRALEQDRIVREGRWEAGRQQLLKVPRLMGQTLGLVAFGRIPRLVALRARPLDCG